MPWLTGALDTAAAEGRAQPRGLGKEMDIMPPNCKENRTARGMAQSARHMMKHHFEYAATNHYP
jgi:hypothetical protein